MASQGKDSRQQVASAGPPSGGGRWPLTPLLPADSLDAFYKNFSSSFYGVTSMQFQAYDDHDAMGYYDRLLQDFYSHYDAVKTGHRFNILAGNLDSISASEFLKMGNIVKQGNIIAPIGKKPDMFFGDEINQVPNSGSASSPDGQQSSLTTKSKPPISPSKSKLSTDAPVFVPASSQQRVTKPKLRPPPYPQPPPPPAQQSAPLAVSTPKNMTRNRSRGNYGGRKSGSRKNATFEEFMPPNLKRPIVKTPNESSQRQSRTKRAPPSRAKTSAKKQEDYNDPALDVSYMQQCVGLSHFRNFVLDDILEPTRVSYITIPEKCNEEYYGKCLYCYSSGQPKEMYESHCLRNPVDMKTMCPELKQRLCPTCGDGSKCVNLHTADMCPKEGRQFW